MRDKMQDTIYFKRKIYNKLLEWKQNGNGKTTLLVEGARRIGKSTIVVNFAKIEVKSSNYKKHTSTDRFYKKSVGTRYVLLKI